MLALDNKAKLEKELSVATKAKDKVNDRLQQIFAMSYRRI